MGWNERLFGFENGVANDPDFFLTNRNAAFYIMSFAPDGDLDSPRTSAARYETSNGLQSNGDLLRPIQGQYKVGHPYTGFFDCSGSRTGRF